MKRIALSFFIVLSLVLFIIPWKLSAQPYSKVTHTSGTQIIAGYSVTVTSLNSAGTNSSCGSSPYHVGKFNNVTDGYRFELSPPTEHVRFEIAGSDHNEEIEFKINGQSYSINSSELSAYPGSCNAGFYAFVTGTGKIGFSGPVVGLNAGTTVDIGPRLISSVEIMETGAYSGSVVSFLFMRDTILYIDSINSSSLCQGDSLYVKYWASNFRPGNKFILQISDTGGSFANLQSLDSISLTISGVIKTVIPPSLLPSSKYKLRLISRFPERISAEGGEPLEIKLRPLKPVATGNTPLCTGGTLNLGALSPTPGVSYGWTGPGGFISGSAAPTRANMTTAQSGNYIATVALNGCASSDTLAVTVYAPTPKPTATSNSPVCADGDINLSAGGVSGANYTWEGPLLFTANGQTVTRHFASLTHGGNYTVRATVNGCASEPDTVNVVVQQGPKVFIYPNPGDTICAGMPLTFSAAHQNAGSNPTFQWYKNGAFTGATGNTYKPASVITGDTFYVRMSAGTVCNTPISSKPVRLTVLPALSPPAISIKAVPGTHVWPYVEVTFIANTNNAGAKPGYQWRRNGADIPNGQDSVLKMTDLRVGDTVCCVVTSNHLCAVPRTVTSNCLVMNVDLGVAVAEPRNDIMVYPNPNKGSFTVKSVAKGTLEMLNTQGQVLHQLQINKGENRINLMELPVGVYILRATDDKGQTGFKRLTITP